MPEIDGVTSAGLSLTTLNASVFLSWSANTPETLITVELDSSATLTSATGATTVGESLELVTLMVIVAVLLAPSLSLTVTNKLIVGCVSKSICEELITVILPLLSM